MLRYSFFCAIAFAIIISNSATSIAQQSAPIHLTGNDQDAFVNIAVDDKNKEAYDLESPNRIHFFASSAIATSESADNFATNGSFQMLAAFHPKLLFGAAYNPIGIQPESISKDSISINNLQFPEAGSAGFMASISWRPFIFKDNSSMFDFFRLSPTAEFSLRNVKFNLATTKSSTLSDSTILIENTIDESKFTVINYNLGLRFEYFHINRSDQSKVMMIGLMPYLNIFNIPNEDAQTFYSTLKTNNTEPNGSQIYSAGAKITLGYKNVIFFADLRQNMKSELNVSGTDLEGFAFNIGTSIVFKIREF